MKQNKPTTTFEEVKASFDSKNADLARIYEKTDAAISPSLESYKTNQDNALSAAEHTVALTTNELTDAVTDAINSFDDVVTERVSAYYHKFGVKGDESHD